MIVLTENKEHCNILHIIIGPESHFPIDLYGFIGADITSILSRLDPSKATMLHFNYCDGEQNLSSHLEHLSTIQNMDQEKESSETIHPKAAAKKGKCPKCGKGDCAIVDDIVQPCESCFKLDNDIEQMLQELSPNRVVKEETNIFKKIFKRK